MLGDMFKYSSPVSSYYASNSDRVDDPYYAQYSTTQRVPMNDRYAAEDWPSPSPDYVPNTRDIREREPYEERTRTIRPDDYYDDRSRFYRSDERYSGRSTRSARSDQDHNWYQSDTTRSSARSYPNRRYPTDTSQYRAEDGSPGKEAFDTNNDRTLRADDKDWYYDHARKSSVGKVDGSTLSRRDKLSNNDNYNKADDANLDQSVAVNMQSNPTNSMQVSGLQKNQDNTCCGFLGNADGTAGSRPVGGLVASYGVLDKSKGGVVVGVAGNRSDTPGDCWRGCCRPAIFTLLILLVLLVFAVVAGFLFYFNYMNYRPRIASENELCAKTYCRWGASCVVGEDGIASCQCPNDCPPAPPAAAICVKDEKTTAMRTYRSHCELQRDACETRAKLQVLHDGPCELSDPCRDMVCRPGARCHSSVDGRTAECRCPESCPKFGDHAGSRPVCANDGKDYADHCEMSKAACDTNTNITVKFIGKCDPCAGVTCPEPEICQLDASRSPVCRCAEPCPLEFTPVCGSDGKTYSNECQARREACRTRRTLRIIYRGQCSSGTNPCESIKCLPGEECSISKFGIARCECGPECEPVMRPVCAVDGRTFSSECELKRAACHAKMPIEIAHPGVCGERGPCQGRTCQWSATCVEHGGQARCECPQCSAEFDPVCGSDGITYGNECKLRLEACKHKREIEVVYKGPCNGCESKKCEYYAVCESGGSTEAKCVCPERCQEGTENGEVCGSDSRTYSSECQLRAKACKDQTELTVLYKGNCGLCRDVECKYGAHCSAGECVCPLECSESGTEPVCANTMVTYASECELQKAACQNKSGIPLTVVFYGDCRERFAVVGSPTTLLPSLTNSAISNEIIHGPTEYPEKSSTTAEREACKDIHCDYEATCELGPDNFPRCSCLFDCVAAAIKGTAKPVCASDLRIYPSMCAMKLEACQRQEELRLRPLELCQGLEVKPCNGETPLVDETTGLEFDCGSGPHRKDCPSGSYCHQTTRAARCCKKDKVQEEKKGCEDSWYGCCPDNLTPAQGPDFAGCPSQCNCNKLGSFSETCSPENQQCDCRPGVGGLKCDRCEPGYWGLPKISAGHQGCIPCGCSMFGSVREDCEQMTGRCVCKSEIQGQKCTICTSHDKILGPNGCFSADVVNLPPTSCKDLNCYFGAVCVERGGLAVCECAVTQCPPESMDTLMVCGSDGQTYTSECHLRLQACRTQTDIVVQAFGICREESVSGTDWPMRRYTPMQYTQPDDGNGHLSKSTRHLLVPEPKYKNENLMTYHKTAMGVDLNFDMNNNVIGKSTSTDIGPKPIPTSRTTLNTITALIGDLCVATVDCLISNTRCIRGACVCSMGYAPSSNRQECIAQPLSPKIRLACDRSPCHYSSTCLDMTDGGFMCLCEPYYTGRLCEFRIIPEHYDVPSFDGHAYIVMKPLSAYHKFSIELEFTAFADNGILLYDQQKIDGSGDFISLSLVSGHVEMRYNLGDGVVSVVTPEAIQMNTLHKISAKRYHRDGMLKLDDGEDTVGQSRGPLKALDLVDHAYVGYVPTNFSRVFENIGIRQGFIGCIHRLKIGKSQIYPQTGRTDNVYNTKNVQECSDNPCASMPCANGGTCHALDKELYRCACIDGFTGDFCETVLDPCSSDPCENGTTCIPDGITFKCICLGEDDTIEDCLIEPSKREVTPIPQFTGSSYVQLPRPEGLGKSFKIEIWFLAKKPSGLLLYTSQSSTKSKGDFVAINLVEGKVQFRFNLGSGIANLVTTESISLETWHRVKVRRSGRDGMIQLDNSTAVRGSSMGPLLELNLEQPLYIGYLPSWMKVHRLSGVTTGFLGAIQRVVVNGKSLKLLNHNNMCMFSPLAHLNVARNKKVACASHGITKYRGPPCFKDTCSGHGICIPVLGDYHCQCDEGFRGENCDQREIIHENDIDDRMFHHNLRNKMKPRLPSNNMASGLYIADEVYEEIS